jgi:hypothetical protein
MADEEPIPPVDTDVNDGDDQDITPEADAAGDEKPGADAPGDSTKTLLSDDESDGAGVVVPDKYVFTTTDELGEIEDTPAAQARFEQFDEMARTAGLTQDQYQSIVEAEITRGRAAMNEMAAGYRERVGEWAEQTKADKDLGGDGLAENLALAKIGMEKLGTPELKKLMDPPSSDNPDGLGLGNHPEVIRLLHRAGVMVRDDRDLIDGDGGKAENDASLRRMYPSMFKTDAA